MAAASKRETPAGKFRLVLGEGGGGVYPFLPPNPAGARIVESITLTLAYLSILSCRGSMRDHLFPVALLQSVLSL